MTINHTPHSHGMEGLNLASTIILFLCVKVSALPFSTIPDEDWSYVEVRPGAHMFWWLYGCTAATRDTLPLVMWLQGGPGGSSTGFGNFAEIGPRNIDQSPRNTTWVQAANILFVDNPVGTGYSYVDDVKLLTTNVTGIAQDLLQLFASFLKTHPIFQELPFYIFSESYGGKMAASFGVALNSAIKSGKFNVKFEGVGLGDGWISPLDTVKSWGPYLAATSLINHDGLAQLNLLAIKCQNALSKGFGVNATEIWAEIQDTVENLTDGVNFYNILEHNGNIERIVNENDLLERLKLRHVGILHKDSLSTLMNGDIKKKLKIPENVTWGGQAGVVFETQREDFMKNVTQDVNSLISSGIKVVIYSGQLDLIVDTVGTMAWIETLEWSNLKYFLDAKRVPLYPPSGKKSKNTGAFVQSYNNFYFCWILKAGHMVPLDAGEMALEMLKMVINVQ